MWPAAKSFARRVAPWLLLIAGIYWLSGTGQTGGGAGAAFPIGAQLPALALELSDGSRVQSPASEILVLNFWATYCAPCRAEAPILSSIHAREAGAVRVIGLSIEGLPAREMVRSAQELGMRYPLAPADIELLERMRVRAVPTTYVVAKDGVITLSRVGMVTEDELEAAIDAAKRRG